MNRKHEYRVADIWRIETAGHLSDLVAGPYRTGRIEVVHPRLSAKQCDDWSRKLNRNYHACGCETATVVVLTGILSFVTYLVIFAGEYGWPHWWQYLLALLVLGVVTALAKRASLQLAASRLKNQASTLAQLYESCADGVLELDRRAGTARELS